jgi:predicted transcriptional regulator
VGHFWDHPIGEWRSLSATNGNVAYNSIMAQQMTRDRIIEALREMPADATVDDAIERLVFLAKIEAGLNELDAGKGIPHEEVKRRLGL